MLLTISKPCSERCGAWVKGEIDTDTRELIYRFLVPPARRCSSRNVRPRLKVCVWSPSLLWLQGRPYAARPASKPSCCAGPRSALTYALITPIVARGRRAVPVARGRPRWSLRP